MQKYYEILKDCSLFDGINSNDLQSLISYLDVKISVYDKKQTIIFEGDEARYIGIVLSGSVQIMQTDYYGNRNLLSVAEPSEIFGEAFACAGIKSIPVSVVAGEKSEIMLIDCEKITNSCSAACSFHRQMIYNLMKILASKNIMLRQKNEILSKRSTREKLMAYLMLQAKKHGRKEFIIPFNRQELADFLSVDRSGMSSEIGKLKKENIIKSTKNRFELL